MNGRVVSSTVSRVQPNRPPLAAALGDYLFIVKALKPADGYYKPDVYLYYAPTLAIPLFAGWRRTLRRTPEERSPSRRSRADSRST